MLLAYEGLHSSYCAKLTIKKTCVAIKKKINKLELQRMFRFRFVNLNIHPVFKDSPSPTNPSGFVANMKTNLSNMKT